MENRLICTKKEAKEIIAESLGYLPKTARENMKLVLALIEKKAVIRNERKNI